jgi:hypothetical protein
MSERGAIERYRAAVLTVTQDVHRARRQLRQLGPEALPVAQSHLENAVARLGRVTATAGLPSELTQVAAAWRVRLSSHLLAAHDLAAAGAPSTTVVRVLRRGTETPELGPLLDRAASRSGSSRGGRA